MARAGGAFGTGMPRNLFEILEWVRANGDPTALLRIRIKLLPLSVKEGIIFDKVEPTTRCSDLYMKATRSAATEVVGRECPL